jgi:N-acetylglutamate synthase
MGDIGVDGLADGAATALLLTFERLLTAGWGVDSPRGEHGTRLITSGIPLPYLNGVFTESRDPDVDEVAEFARRMTASAVPWSIQVRGEPAPEFVEVAARFGLTHRVRLPLMAMPAAPVALTSGDHSIRTVGGKDHEIYRDALAAGFEAPVDIMAALAQPEILDMPGATAYLVEADGEPVSTGKGILVGDHVGVFNVSTPPRHRRRGYGRAATEVVMRDGFAAGARVAFLQASYDGLPLYELLGFRVVETWTYFQRG